jgi:peroxiredoxin
VVIKIEKMNNQLELAKLKIGDKIPDWSLELIFEENLPKTDDFLGKPLLILFFSLGCPGCLGRAIPYANRIVYENGDKINVIGIHTNFEAVNFTKEQFQRAKENYFIRFSFYMDYNYDTTFLNYGAGGTPHWILVDKEGIVIYSIFGSDPNNALLRLDYLINELILGI